MNYPNNRERVRQLIDLLNPPPDAKECIYAIIYENNNTLQNKFPIINWMRINPESIALLISLNRERTYNKSKVKQSVPSKSHCLAGNLLDIVKYPDDVNKIDKQMIEEGIINEELQYLTNKKFENFKCIQGVFFLMEEQNYFKKIDFKKSSKHKYVSHRQLINAFIRRYGIIRFKTIQPEYRAECMQIALKRLPIIAELQKRRKEFFLDF